MAQYRTDYERWVEAPVHHHPDYYQITTTAPLPTTWNPDYRPPRHHGASVTEQMIIRLLCALLQKGRFSPEEKDALLSEALQFVDGRSLPIPATMRRNADWPFQHPQISPEALHNLELISHFRQNNPEAANWTFEEILAAIRRNTVVNEVQNGGNER